MISENGSVQTSPKGSFSFPYGAAALSRLLSETKTQQARNDLKVKMRAEFLDAFANLELPQSLRYKAEHYGLTLYLSGGGFRGWGYLLMASSKIKPYPIPIINGFHVSVKDFTQLEDLQDLAEDYNNVFRVSKRRAAQVPAVAFLVSVLTEALPFISDVRFCQGGVREGFLFDNLPDEIRSLSPLTSATSHYPKHSESSAYIATLLHSSLPGENNLNRTTPSSLTKTLTRAVSDTMYVQSSSIKESASTAALYLPITGVLSSAHGVSHTDRALLSLILCQRWEGELPPPHDGLQSRLQCMLSQQEVWWCNYLGAIASLIGFVYPAGRVADLKAQIQRLGIKSRWSEGLGKKGNLQGIVLQIKLLEKEAVLGGEQLKAALDRIEDLGKKKNRVGGKEYGFGLPVRVDVDWI